MEKPKKYPNGKHPNSLKNLKPQRSDEPSHGPKGRTKKEATFSDLAREKAAQVCLRWDANGRTWAQYLVDKWFEHAVDNPIYFKELLDRTDGKVTQPIVGNVSGEITIDYRDKLLDAISRHSARGGEEENTKST